MRRLSYEITKNTLAWIWSLLVALDHRAALVFIGVVLAVVSVQQQPFSFWDRASLSIASRLFEPPKRSANISIVRIPDHTFSLWQSDFYRSAGFSAVVTNLLHDQSTFVGVVMDQAPPRHNSLIDEAAEQLVGVESLSDSDFSNALQQKVLIESLIAHPRVLIGIDETQYAVNANHITTLTPPLSGKRVFEGQSERRKEGIDSASVGDASLAIDQAASFLDTVLNANSLASCSWCFWQRQEPIPVKTSSTYRPISKPDAILAKDLFVRIDDHRHPSFVFSFLDKYFTYSEQKPFRDIFPLDGNARGQYLPINSLSKRLYPLVEEIPIDEALARSAFPDLLLVSSVSNNNVQRLSAQIYSIQNQQLAFVPPWWGMLSAFLIVLLAAVNCLIARICTTKMLLSILLGTIVLVIVIQFYCLLALRVWLPFTSIVIFIMVAGAMMSLWKARNNRVLHWINQADSASISLADYYLKSNQIAQAKLALAETSASEAVLEKLYEIAERSSREKNYDLSFSTYLTISQRRKKFRDTPQKLELVRQVIESENRNNTFTATSENKLEKTVALSGPTQAMPRMLGRYEIKDEIGRGAVGRVFLGFDPKIARKVAIKTLNYNQFDSETLADVKARFFREAEAAGRLSHPNIVSIYDVGEQDYYAYIAMDYVEGKALNQFIDEEALLPVFEVYRVVADIASAMAYAHSCNVVHRDVKPANVIYNPSPFQVKVTDFGIARLIDDSKTSTGEILGSPLYMAPEQLAGSKVDVQADIFSLGVTFYQLLTGELPFKGENLAALTYEIIHGKHKNIRSVRKGLPASAARIINQALQKNPEERYESAAEMAGVLTRAIRRDFPSEASQAGIL